MVDPKLFETARGMARFSLQYTQSVEPVLKPEHIVAAVNQVLENALFSAFGAQERQQLINELESSFKTFVGEARALSSKEHKPWLKKRKSEIQWDFWTRYRDFLLIQGWHEPTLKGLDEFTDITLDYLPDPTREDTWDVRGLVVGHVQSGKTSNYTGLICKAADAGYKVIVVLAGMHKSLRAQTQIRLEEGFLGYQTPSGRTKGAQDEVTTPVGVGLGSSLKTQYATTRADSGDFNRNAANHWGVALSPDCLPTLFVIKKNGSVLRNLVAWVRSQADRKDSSGNRYVPDVPILVIDDEADQGSIDTKAKDRDASGIVDEDHDPTVLNRRIRELLMLFDRSAYVAYTATPFANVLIHRDNTTPRHGPDLFPKDFIVSLPAPSNYVGPVRVFGLSQRGDIDPVQPLPIIRRISDWADDDADERSGGWMPPRHRKDHLPLVDGVDRVPDSLAEAVRSFTLSVAARAARGQKNAHNSMLVHVTRFTAVQHLIGQQVKGCLASLESACRFDDPLIWASLKDLWETDFEPTTAAIDEDGCESLDWETVKAHVMAAVSSISVHEVNGAAGDILDYETYKEEGLNVIAVGGDKLSRGLTLEGLTVSYFLRASRMYDTLMQMGRWFGYRPGYLDLCRIYTTDELIEWFEHITVANEDLREEFNAMWAARQTPEDYGHRVLSHPVLLVTSQVKMRDGESIPVSFAGSISESVAFHRAPEEIENNFEATKDLVNRLGGPESALKTLPNTRVTMGSRLVWNEVPADQVIAFLQGYHAHESATRAIPSHMAEYIRKQLAHEELESWTVALIGGQGKANSQLSAVTGEGLKPARRKWAKSAPLPSEVSNAPFRIGRPVSPIDEALDLDDTSYDRAFEMTLEAHTPDGADKSSKNEPKLPSGVMIRKVRSPKKGLLLLYALSPTLGDEHNPVNQPAQAGADSPPIVAIAISFPGSKTNEMVEYVVNSVYGRQEYGSIDDA